MQTATTSTPKRIYMVARWVPLANPLDRGYRARFHTMGAFLNIENARIACVEANNNLLKHRHSEGWYTDHRYLHHVISYKIRDASSTLLPPPSGKNLEPEYCHAGRDGDCNHPRCPQEANNRANYQISCPLLRHHEEG